MNMSTERTIVVLSNLNNVFITRISNYKFRSTKDISPTFVQIIKVTTTWAQVSSQRILFYYYYIVYYFLLLYYTYLNICGRKKAYRRLLKENVREKWIPWIENETL